jgi:hypothetical protein
MWPEVVGAGSPSCPEEPGEQACGSLGQWHMGRGDGQSV